ncbi:hypothetical protein FOL47_006886 [Perkinsus chesapeaki]|uniref:NET domain-containing protein n=1 Tax=Perkinsus chesapeaki TaxID=330153 RepID=A0A7J6LPM7_PERCH|nr:hypothetical protein FOL47_006886 [Perkinsus chesapeaki]
MLQVSPNTAESPEILHRGERFLCPEEAAELNEQIDGSGMIFEEVEYPPVAPPSSANRRTKAKAKAKSLGKRRKTTSSSSSSPTSSQTATSPGSPRQSAAPKRRGRPSKTAAPASLPLNTASEDDDDEGIEELPNLEGLAGIRRTALLDVLKGIKSDSRKREQHNDSIYYWYGTATFPEQVEGAKPKAYQLPTDLGTIRENVIKGNYETHLAMEKDINKIVRHGLKGFPSDSGPFRAAERLNKLAAGLVQKASYRINNEDYKEKYISTEIMAAIFTKEGASSVGSSPKKEKREAKQGIKKGGSKKSSKGEGTRSKDSEKNLEALNSQIAALQEKLAELADQGVSLTRAPTTSPGSPPEGGVGRSSQAPLPLTLDEKSKLEDDMNQLTAEDLALVVEKKLKGRPGVVLDPATGQLCELDVDLMSARDQRNLKRYVARLLNLHNQKVKENEERAREIVAHEKAVAQLQAERALKRKYRGGDHSSSSSSSDDDDSSSSSGSSSSDSSDDEGSGKDELSKIYEKGTGAV